MLKTQQCHVSMLQSLGGTTPSSVVRRSIADSPYHGHDISQQSRQRVLVISDVPILADSLTNLARVVSGQAPDLSRSWPEARKLFEQSRYALVIVCALGSITRQLQSLDQLARPDHWLILPVHPSQSLTSHAQQDRRLSLMALASTQDDVVNTIASLLGRPQRPCERTSHHSAPRRALTRQEHSILTLLAEGLSTRQIANRLDITSGTTRNSLSRTYRKLGVHDRTAAALAYRALYLDV